MATNFHPLSPDKLRWQVDEKSLKFQSTADVQPAAEIVGQPIARDALAFGLASTAPGQNIFVRGLTGTGRMTLVRSLLESMEPAPRRRVDLCYVHNFRQPDRPRLITLPAGQGRQLRREIHNAAVFIRDRLDEALNSGPIAARRQAIQERIDKQIRRITGPLENKLRKEGLTLVRIQTGPVSQTAIFPLVMDKPVPPEELKEMVTKGQAGEYDYENWEKGREKYSKEAQKTTQEANRAWEAGLEELREFNESEARKLLENLTDSIVEHFAHDGVTAFISEIIDDVLEQRLGGDTGKLADPTQLYGVNVISQQRESDQAPVIVETTPSVINLLGTIDPAWLGTSRVVSSYRGIRAGSLVQADGGFLVLDARDVLTETGAWKMLMRTLRTGVVEIVPPELGWPYSAQSLKPEPIPVKVRVVLIGDDQLFAQLDRIDADFTDLFKVLADFDTELERSDETMHNYAGVIARLVARENLRHFDRSAVAALIEHGARIAGRSGMLTARFGRLADLAREADYLAALDDDKQVGREHVENAVQRTKYRASLAQVRHTRALTDGKLRIAVRGNIIGQVNGLAITRTGTLTYGFPTRITATVGPGRSGLLSIEGASDLSGRVHTKGFHILGGLLRHLLRTEHPLTFSASLAFEQSYGGIDGDSASAAEACCLISALTAIPLRQELAVTGAIDQHGHIQAVGSVNEKIEGFFDTCQAIRQTGDQGVIIPRANAGDLMLRRDVVRACQAGSFNIYVAETIHQVLEMLTGQKAGVLLEGRYSEGTLLHRARQRAAELWRMAQDASPGSK